MHNESAERTLIEAIARCRHVSATYNGIELLLAPHQLFSRRGDLYVSALNTGRSWRSDEEPRLGQFKLSGLSGVTLVDDPFAPLADFADLPVREGDESLFAVALG